MTAFRTYFPQPVDKKLGESKLADFIKACHGKQITDIETLINKNNHRELLEAIFSDSPYLSHLIFRDVIFAHQLLSGSLDDHYTQVMGDLAKILPSLSSSNKFSSALRQAKAQMALLISFADLSGLWPLDIITRRLTAFAELSVSYTVSHLLKAEIIRGNLAVPAHLRPHAPEELWADDQMSKGTGYVVLAMGKMGGYELNYSSDIDLIVLYDNDLVHYTGRKTPQDLFIKVTQGLVKIMQERTAEGYVFRTDLRLRPDPGATAIALSMEGAEIYYQSMGLNWERAAMIKARPVAGDLDAGFDFLIRIKSFVWRKHLDYVALEDIYAIKKMIHQHHGHKGIRFAGQDIKLGHGGIREIEFYAQIFQLISGGREPALRTPATCDALNRLAETQKLSKADNQKLQKAYVYYRRLEHRLQMINDDQTHSLPEKQDDLNRITSFMGYDNQEKFEKDLHLHLNDVHMLFISLLKDTNQAEEENEQALTFPSDGYNSATLKYIRASGYLEPEAIYDIIRTWHLGRYRACRTERARKLLDSFVPEILSCFGKLGNADESFKKFDRFLSRLPSGVQFFSFIKAQPWLLELLAEIIGMAPYLSDQLAKRPLLLDAVLNEGFFGTTFTEEKLSHSLQGQLAVAKDFQDVIDISRQWASEYKFQVGVQILRHQIDANSAGKNLSMIADIVLTIMLEKVTQEFSQKHGTLADTQFAILALGKLGGRELTTTSDLDLVFIYEATSAPPFSNGHKKLSVNHYFSRLSQQFINALTAMTGEGRLYEVDMRLRPSGNAGPIAVTLTSFEDYQKQKAWTWEHLALTRGRVITGTADITDKINDIVHGALTSPQRDQKILLQDTAQMRDKLAKEFGTHDIWAIKYVRGGLVDIEFICQYLILKHGADIPQIIVPNSLEQISQLKKYNILSQQQGDFLFASCDFMQNLQVILRLCLGSNSPITDQHYELIDSLCRRFNVDNLAMLRHKITETQKGVYHVYRTIIEEPAKEIIEPITQKI